MDLSFSYFISKRLVHSKLEYLDQSSKQLPIAFIILTKMQPLHFVKNNKAQKYMVLYLLIPTANKVMFKQR